MNRPDFATWFWINLKIGALSFGSASRTLLYENEVVRGRNWMTPDEFQEALTLAQILPGPNLVNLSAGIGYRLFSPLAAAISVLPLILPGAILIILMVLWVPLDRPWIGEFFRGLAIGAFFLMGRFLWNLFKGIPAGVGAPVPMLKRWIRYGLAAAVSFGIFEGVSAVPLVLSGVCVCLILEFAV